MQPLALTDAQASVEPAARLPEHRVVRPAASTTAWDALQGALEDWRGGRTSWEHWGEPARRRARPSRVSSASTSRRSRSDRTSRRSSGSVAASIPDGSRVLAPDVEFTSTLFPFLVQEHPRCDDPARSPQASSPAQIGPDVDVVAFSAVQMATGEVADLDAIAPAAAEHDALTVVDATQAVGWLPLDASRFDVVVAHAYKWLMSPRARRSWRSRGERLDAVVPHAAGWYAGEDPMADLLRRPSAPRGERAPARHVAGLVHVGRDARRRLAVIEQIGIEAIHEHDVALANRFRAGLGLEPSDSAIVMSGRARCSGQARPGRDPGRRARWATAHVVARLQHGWRTSTGRSTRRQP